MIASSRIPVVRWSRRLLAGALAFTTLSLAPGLAGAQRAVQAEGVAASRPPAADAFVEQAAARVAGTVCGKRVVLLGELPEHGEAHGFAVKSRIVEQLVARCGFRTVLFEAGSYDFFGLERAIAAAPRAGRRTAADPARKDSLALALARAIGGFWWTRELAGWRDWLLGEALTGRVMLGGIDDQLGATGAYARATLPGMVSAAVHPARAAACGAAVTRYLNWGYTDAIAYDASEQERLADCASLAADRTRGRGVGSPGDATRKTPDAVMLDDLASFFARERQGAGRGTAASPDRDSVMAAHVGWWAARLPRDAKIIVWTATTHASRAGGANDLLPGGVPPMGARLAGQWGGRMAAIGFSALQGEWSRAGQPAKPLPPLPSGSLEEQALARRISPAAAQWGFLDGTELRSLGAIPSRLFGKVVTTDWSRAFDGVLVIRDEVAPTAERRR